MSEQYARYGSGVEPTELWVGPDRLIVADDPTYGFTGGSLTLTRGSTEILLVRGVAQ